MQEAKKLSPCPLVASSERVASEPHSCLGCVTDLLCHFCQRSACAKLMLQRNCRHAYANATCLCAGSCVASESRIPLMA